MSAQHSAIIRDFERVPAHVVAEASKFQPAILADVAGRRGAMHGRIKALHPRMKLAGSAFTVEVRPGDNLMIHAAIELIKPGDVLVIDGKGDQTVALIGSIMVNICRSQGVVGVVMDGACRDSIEIDQMDYPVFSAGTNANGPTRSAPGRIGHPISCGGVTVCPGDFVTADGDGVVVVGRGQIASLLLAAATKTEEESGWVSAIRDGKRATNVWLTPALRAAGAINEGEVL